MSVRLCVFIQALELVYDKAIKVFIPHGDKKTLYTRLIHKSISTLFLCS